MNFYFIKIKVVFAEEIDGRALETSARLSIQAIVSWEQVEIIGVCDVSIIIKSTSYINHNLDQRCVFSNGE